MTSARSSDVVTPPASVLEAPSGSGLHIAVGGNQRLSESPPQPRLAGKQVATPLVLSLSTSAELPSANLYVSNIAALVSRDEFRQMFENFGEVVSHKLMVDIKSGAPRGFGFILFKRPEDAAAAMQALDGFELHGLKLVIKIADSRTRNPESHKLTNRVFLRNLPSDYDDRQVKALCGEYCTIQACFTKIDDKHGHVCKNRALSRTAHVTVPSTRDAAALVDALDGSRMFCPDIVPVPVQAKIVDASRRGTPSSQRHTTDPLAGPSTDAPPPQPQSASVSLVPSAGPSPFTQHTASGSYQPATSPAGLSLESAIAGGSPLHHPAPLRLSANDASRPSFSTTQPPPPHMGLVQWFHHHQFQPMPLPATSHSGVSRSGGPGSPTIPIHQVHQHYPIVGGEPGLGPPSSGSVYLVSAPPPIGHPIYHDHHGSLGSQLYAAASMPSYSVPFHFHHQYHQHHSHRYHYLHQLSPSYFPPPPRQPADASGFASTDYDYAYSFAHAHLSPAHPSVLPSHHYYSQVVAVANPAAMSGAPSTDPHRVQLPLAPPPPQQRLPGQNDDNANHQRRL